MPGFLTKPKLNFLQTAKSYLLQDTTERCFLTSIFIMTVFARTSAGIAAAKDPASALPHELRMLLTSIDGRTHLSAYISILAGFGDVRKMVQSLVQSGYVQEIEDSGASLGANQLPASPAWARPNSSFSQVKAPLQNPTRPSGVPDFKGRQTSSYQPAIEKTQSHPSQSESKNRALDDLRSAILLMCDFVTMHMPTQSLELLLELESVTSPAELIASLPGYEAMVADFGEPARQHIAELHTLLKKA